MEVIEIDDFMTQEECDHYIEGIESKENVRKFTTTGIFKNDRYKDSILANHLFSKLNVDLDIRPHSLIITGKYVPGQRFGLHTDAGDYYDHETGERSKYTMIVYLNEPVGGELQFYDNVGNKMHLIAPKMGKCVIFDIDLFHEALPVLERNKYWIGMELIGK